VSKEDPSPLCSREKENSMEPLFNPCPFCGREEPFIGVKMGGDHTGIDSRPIYWIECIRCGAHGPQSLDKDIVRKQWNGAKKVLEGK
jgi:hypothetical protein